MDVLHYDHVLELVSRDGFVTKKVYIGSKIEPEILSQSENHTFYRVVQRTGDIIVHTWMMNDGKRKDFTIYENGMTSEAIGEN